LHTVDDYLRRITEGADFPAFAQQMRETMSVLESDGASVQRLANIVLRDYALTLKIIRAANSVHYNRTGRPIQSATHAMLLLGARTVRTIASGMLLFEHYHNRSPGLKELMLLSMLTANQARETALRLGLADPEEAHLCGMFRNLGEVLIACHFPDQYAEILAKVKDGERGESAAAFAVLGFHYEELGGAMARHWSIPESVQQAMHTQSLATASPLALVATFSHDLAAAIYRQEPDRASDAVDGVVKRYASRLKLSQDDVRDIVTSGVAETREIFASAHVSLDDLRLKRQVAAALGDVYPTGTTPVDSLAIGAVPQLDLRERLRREVADAIAAEEALDLDRILLMVLEGLLRGGPFDRVVLAVVTASRTDVHGRLGLGDGSEELVARFRFPLSPTGSAIGAALCRRQDTLVAGRRDVTVQQRSWLQLAGAGIFGVYPIVVARKLVGCLYVDRKDGDQVPNAATLAFIGELRELAAHAIERRRAIQASQAAAARIAARARATTSAAGVPAAAEQDGTEWTPARKSEIVLRILRGEALVELSEVTGVSVAELEQWRDGFLAGALAGLERQAS
jgi:HD-like signal output (HDOD) protein